MGFNPKWTIPKPVAPKIKPKILSNQSTAAVQDSLWFSQDLQLAASVVIIQPSTGLFVLLSEKQTWKFGGKEIEEERWFLPRGRKDMGETIEETAVREGYEESGYRCTLMPLDVPTNATRPLDKDKKPLRSRYPNCEPIYIQVIHNPPPARLNLHTEKWHDPDEGGTEYICFYYIAEIPEDAVQEKDTKMWDEQGYVSHLLPFEEAKKKLERCDVHMYHVLCKAGQIWEDTKAYEAMKAAREEKRKEEAKRKLEEGGKESWKAKGKGRQVNGDAFARRHGKEREQSWGNYQRRNSQHNRPQPQPPLEPSILDGF